MQEQQPMCDTNGYSDVLDRVFEPDPTGWHANVISILDVCTVLGLLTQSACIDSDLRSHR